MEPTITSEIVVAYAQCPRKAYLLLFSPDRGEPHEYVQILEQQRGEHQERYCDRLQQKHADVQPYTLENLRHGSEVLINACLQVDRLEAACGILTRVEGKPTFGKYNYEPSIFVGTYSISKEQKLELSFVGKVLGRLQNKLPVAGRIIGMDGKPHTIKLDTHSKDLIPLLEPLQEWTEGPSSEPPPVILNKHCPLCPFQRLCYAQAEQEDNLSLLDGITARVMRQYERKGIFTVKQLSYLFKTRKRKKRSRKPPPVSHKVELQALAIRENKIYLQELPALSRHPVELFLDMEGVPDRDLYYLIGVLVCQPDTTPHYAFWANTDQDERQMWQQFLDKVNQYSDAPIYHYGSYEPRAIATLAKRYQTDAESVTKRLVNVNRYIYGKVYFPVRSNGLKAIGNFIGAKWTSPQASGLQSLVWRHHWEKTHEVWYQELLVVYNREDCQALKLLTDELHKINNSADILSKVDFSNQPKPRMTEVSEKIYSQFRLILRSARTDYHIERFINLDHHQRSRRKKKYHQRKRNRNWQSTKIVQVPQSEFCRRCEPQRVLPSTQVSNRTIIDLILPKSGIKKTTTKYVGIIAPLGHSLADPCAGRFYRCACRRSRPARASRG
jgi:predicted RecB family nuclease